MELYLPPIFEKKEKRAYRPKITWTDEKLGLLKELFPFTFNCEIAKKLGISKTAVNVKARALGLKKEDGFLDKRRQEITRMATEKLKIIYNPFRGKKGWCVPGGEKTQFKPGNLSVMSYDPEVVQRSRLSRMETIRREKLRIKIGLPQKTRLRLSDKHY